ncbi:MAG: iron-containing alcohol dehydrogenase [Eubacterium sp.]|nr:iron-containing alcohol dehydrogenase [Eubacterium sp.]
MEWSFKLPVRIEFGTGKRKNIKSYIDDIGGSKGVLVCSKTLERNGVSKELTDMSEGRLVAVFSDIRPNPTTDNVNACAALLRSTGADFAVALGGGSPMDCCKAACAIAKSDSPIEPYHSGEKAVSADEAIPMIAIATTSGTASEVTNISVLTDLKKNLKQPMNDEAMFPKIAVIDPELTLSVPPQVTASTGLDVLAHAVESYWSTLNQPVCSACSVSAARTVFEWLEKAYNEPDNLKAREKMAEASIVAGVAFSHPRTTGSHACSFPLTNIYGMPHGEACAFTLDYFLRFNADNADGDGRIAALANACGFESAYAMADEISALKKRLGMRTRLSEIDCTGDAQIKELAEKSMSMLMTRNPIELTLDDITKMYYELI